MAWPHMESTGEDRLMPEPHGKDDVTNRELLRTLDKMESNHLTTIQNNTSETNQHMKMLIKIVWILIGLGMTFLIEDIIVHMIGG